MPKALLPIANQPMISYPLSWLEASGVSGTPFPILHVIPSFAQIQVPPDTSLSPNIRCHCRQFELGIKKAWTLSGSSLRRIGIAAHHSGGRRRQHWNC